MKKIVAAVLAVLSLSVVASDENPVLSYHHKLVDLSLAKEYLSPAGLPYKDTLPDVWPIYIICHQSGHPEVRYVNELAVFFGFLTADGRDYITSVIAMTSVWTCVNNTIDNGKGEYAL